MPSQSRTIVIRLTTQYPGRTLSGAELEPEFDLATPPAAAPAASEDDSVAQAMRHLEGEHGVNPDRMLRSLERAYIDAALRLTLLRFVACLLGAGLRILSRRAWASLRPRGGQGGE